MLATVERISRFTPLGIRFWDPVQDRQISDGLRVEAWAETNPARKADGFRTQGGIYCFKNIPGMLDIELANSFPETDSSPPATQNYVVAISDTFNRYLDVSFSVALPLNYKGLFLAGLPSDPVSSSPKGFYLYPTVVAKFPQQYAQLRGDLLDFTTGEPAAYALLRVQTEEAETWFGISDSNGRFVVMMPYPALPDGFGGSPAMGEQPLHLQTWNVDLEVSYSPASLSSLAGTEVPAYLSILNQTPADIHTNDPNVSAVGDPVLPLTITFDQPTIARTDGYSELYVSPSAS